MNELINKLEEEICTLRQIEDCIKDNNGRIDFYRTKIEGFKHLPTPEQFGKLLELDILIPDEINNLLKRTHNRALIKYCCLEGRLSNPTVSKPFVIQWFDGDYCVVSRILERIR